MLLIISIALVTWLLSLFLPWWSLIIPCLVFGALLGKKKFSAFYYGFTAIALLWLFQILWIYTNDGDVMATRIAELFSLPHPWLVVAATVLIGGLTGGLSTLTGYLSTEVFQG